MTISFPLSLPTSSSPLRIELSIQSNTAVRRSAWTLASQKQRNKGQLWVANITYPPLTRAQAEELAGFIMALDGPWGTFTLGDPLGVIARGNAGGNPKVNGANQTGGSLVTDGWDASQTGILKAGDYIQIGTRLHKLKADANSDGSGNATLDIWPDLRSPAPADNDTIITQGAKGLFQLADNTNPLISAGIERVYDFSIAAIEAW